METSRVIITIGQDQTPGIFSKKAEDGANTILITARTFDEATTLYSRAGVEALE